MTTNVNFRASAIGKIMTGCKLNNYKDRLTVLQAENYLKLSNKENDGSITAGQQKTLNSLQAKIDEPNTLSETAKTYIKEVYLKNEFGFDDWVQTKEMKKGIIGEDDALMLLSKVTGRTLFKNENRTTKDHISGEHDTKHEDTVIDVKSSWSPLTFMKADFSDLYQWQLRAYMFLTDSNKAELSYCLIDIPASVFRDLERQAFWQYDIIDDATDEALKITERLQTNFIYSNQERYKPELRVKRFFIDRDYELEYMMHQQIKLALEYYEFLTLNMTNDDF